MKTNFTTVDEYIVSCPEETRGRLQEIRAAVRVAVPDAKEKISYQIAAFELNGKGLLSFAGWKNPLPMKLIGKVIKLHVTANLKRTGKSKT
jgi:uncharacterized protein YdhG (YjbR/CyaY superfamily)